MRVIALVTLFHPTQSLDYTRLSRGGTKKSFLRQSKGQSVDSPEQTERAVLKGADSGTIAGRDFVKAPWNTAERLCRTRICRERPLLNRRMR